MKKYLEYEMKNAPLLIPVLFLIFNRPDTTQQVFNEIRKTRPNKLFIAADGPRKNNSNDALLCQQTRDIVNLIDWDCEVHTLFREENLGCKFAVSSAIDWFFSHVEEGIILEDDCLPDQSFFPFCQELLERYRDDERIMMISGDNFQFGRKRDDYSYYFSRYAHIWGWATWRRGWKHYDRDMKLWPEVKRGNWLFDILLDRKIVNYWEKIFDQSFNGEINTWDYQWVFSCWIQNGLSIIPDVNLVTNIGFGDRSTHTKVDTPFSNMPVEKMRFPIIHPPFIIRDDVSDNTTEKKWFSQSGTVRDYLKLPFLQ